MGCCTSNITELALSFQVYLYKLVPTDEQYVFKITEVVKSTFDKDIGVSLFQILSEDSNEQFQNLTQTKSLLSKSMYYLYSSRIRALRSYKQLQTFQPCDFPQLSKIAIIDISEALKVDITKKIITKLTKKLIEFKNKVISAVELKKEMEKANNPILTTDNFRLETSNNEDDKEEDNECVVRDDEMVIEFPLTEEEFCQIKNSLFIDNNAQSPKIRSNNQSSNPTTIPIQMSNNNNNGNQIQIENINEMDPEYNKEGGGKLNQLTKIQKVFITKSKINTVDQFKKVMQILAQYNSLRKFGFFDNFISNDFEGWEYLGDLFSENSSIRWIDLHSSTLFDYQIGEIIRGLQLKRIRYLDLSENFLSSDGMKVLSKWLATNKTMQKLNLSRNAVCQFRTEGVRLITEALLNHPNIKSLDFSHMDITQCGCHFNKFLTTNNKIEELILRNMKLNYKDFKDICEGVLTSPSLKKLDLGMNDMGGDKSLKEIANIIENNSILETLNLDQMNLNMDNYEIIFDPIEKNNTITYYSLSFNPDLKPKLVLNFFLKKEWITRLDYIPWNPDNDKDKGKCFTLEEKKLIEKFISTRPRVKLMTQYIKN